MSIAPQKNFVNKSRFQLFDFDRAWKGRSSFKDLLAGVTVGRGAEPKTKVFDYVVFIDICMFWKFAHFKKDC